jgi:iron(III) transport system substrate-binding protein
VLFAINGTVSLLKRENALARFTAPGAANFPAQFKDNDGVLTAFRHTPVSILYNTELVKAADLPQDFDDLLQPKWQHRIAMPDPSRHTSGPVAMELAQDQRRQMDRLRSSAC